MVKIKRVQTKKTPRPKSQNGGTRARVRPATQSLARPKAPRATRAKPPTHQHSHSPATKAVCAMINPFCDDAVGARYADAAASASLPYTIRGSGVLTVGGGGGGAVFFRATPTGIQWIQTTGATDAVQTTAAAWNTIGSFPSGYDETRYTSWGVKFTNMLPVNTSSGVLKAVTLSEPPLVSTAYNIGDYTYQKIELTALAPGASGHWISKQTNTMRARQFLPPQSSPSDGDIADVQLPGWQVFGIFVQGAPTSTNPVFFEVVGHVEFTVNPTSSLVPYLRPMPPANPRLSAVVDRVVSSAPQTHFNKTTEAVDSFLASAATVALNKAASWAAENGIAGIVEMMGAIL